MATVFTVDRLQELGVCDRGLVRVEAFGGAIANTPAGWRAYVARFPEAWRAPLFTAWRLRRRGWSIPGDLVWRGARIAYREQPETNAHLRRYADTLGPENWREARDAAAAAAYAAADDAAAAAAADDDAAAAAARQRVRDEIVEMAIAALVAADPDRTR